MSSKNPELPSFMDGVHVKISEQYKPPKRILLPTFQRLPDLANLNYDFQLEESIKDRMKELRTARHQIRSRRDQKIETLSKDTKKDEDGVTLIPTTTTTPATTTPHSIPNNINFSDFESDLSTPFDNMELKTINDFAELAQVLQQQQQQEPPRLNGYYRLQDESKDEEEESKIPSIINQMQMDLKLNQGVNSVLPQDPPVSKPESAVALANPYLSLNGRMQAIVREVSLMGFPIDRVARAAVVIGDDQPKLIEHMIAMSQLLDLGFQEEEISKALLNSENDRDKALDYLVT